jgi:triacylglycerol lipase
VLLASAALVAAAMMGAGPPSPGIGAGSAPVLTPTPFTGVPVLLVPGWLDSERDLAALRIRLLSAGWPTDHVAALTFRVPTGSNRTHAEEIDSAARALMERTGAQELDVVAHSMGGLATRWLLAGTDAPPVRRAVFVASPHRGTYSAYVAWGDGSEEMKPGSPFLDSLNAAPPVPGGVRALTIRTLIDTHIVPAESATLPGVPDETVCCPSHAGLLHDLEVFRIIRRFLDGSP